MVLVDTLFLFVWGCCSLRITGIDLVVATWQFDVVVVVSEVQEPRLDERCSRHKSNSKSFRARLKFGNQSTKLVCIVVELRKT